MKKSVAILLATMCLGTLSACVPMAPDQPSSETRTTETSTNTKSSQSTDQESSSVQAAPDFTVMDGDGKKINLSDYKGKKVYINIWATWCGPCRTEMPELEKVYQAHKGDDDLVFISIASPSDRTFENDNPMDGSKSEIMEMANELGVTYPILYDYRDTAVTAYQIRAIPTHLFVNSDGTLAQQIPGGLTGDMLEEELDKLK